MTAPTDTSLLPARRALVTGATGFVGGHLVRRLVTDGWQVHCIVRPGSRLGLLEGWTDRLTLHCHDDTPENLARVVAVSAPAVVLHLASLFLSEHRPDQISSLVSSNVRFGAELLEAMSANGVQRLVNTGTAWQHFHVGASNDYRPVNLYAATKQAFEAILDYYLQTTPLRAVTLKLSDTYGPEDPRPKLLALLARLTAGNGQPLAMSAGEQHVDLVHIEDVCGAYVTAVRRLLDEQTPVGGHEIYAVTSGTTRTLREVVAAYEEAIGSRLPIQWDARPYRVREVMNPWIGGEPLPGWRSKVTLLDGLRTLLI